MFELNLKKFFSRTTTKSIPLLQPEHGFWQQNEPELCQVQGWYPNEKTWQSLFVLMVDVVFHGV